MEGCGKQEVDADLYMLRQEGDLALHEQSVGEEWWAAFKQSAKKSDGVKGVNAW